MKKFDPIASYTLVNQQTQTTKLIKRFQSRRFVFAVRFPDQWRKVFQVIFSRSDGSLFVNVPYSSIKHGIVSEGTLPRLGEEIQIRLAEHGKVTSKHVKYSHHPDGMALFSQTGQVRTEIRNQSLPLNKSHGHIFTLECQDLLQFDEVQSPRDTKSPTRKRALLTYNFENLCPLALKFTGWWYRVGDLGSKTGIGDVGPRITSQKPDGTRSPSFIVGSLFGDPLHDFTLVVTCESRSLIDTDRSQLLNILGGFSSMHAKNSSSELSFMCALYPASDYETLVHQIGSIDLIEPFETTNEESAG
jgi:hypothetical protein